MLDQRVCSHFLLSLLVVCLPLSAQAKEQMVPGDAPAKENQPRLVVQLGHAGGVTSVAFSADGKKVLTGSLDQTARLWETATGKELRVFRGHEDSVSSVALSADLKWALTGSRDKTARLWEVATGKVLRTYQGRGGWRITTVAFSADGRHFLTDGEFYTARLWDAASGKEIHAFRHASFVKAVAFSPDGKWALTGSMDKTARLWDVATGQELRVFQGHSHYVEAVAFSPDAKWVVTGSWDRTARLWDAATGKELRAFSGHTQQISSVACSANGKWVLTGSWDKTARLWEAASGRELHKFLGHGDRVNSVAFSPDGRWVLTGSTDKSARLWDVGTGKESRAFRGNAEFVVSSVAFSPDFRWMLTGNWDHTARLWDVKSGQRARTFRGHTGEVKAVAFSPDAKWVLTGSQDQTARLWNVADGKAGRVFQGHSGGVNSVAFSPDGKWVLTGSDDQTARLWEAATGKEVRSFECLAPGKRGGVLAGALSADGKFVLTASYNQTVRLWESSTGKEVGRFEGAGGGFTAVAFSPDGKWVLTGSGDGMARLWEATTGKESQSLKGHLNRVTAAVFSPDGKWVLTGSQDQTARLWEVASGNELRTFTKHTGGLTAVAFSADGKWVLTGSRDGTARLWESKSGKALCQFVSFSGETWAVVDQDGRYDAANGGEVEGLHWVVSNEAVALKQLKERYYDPGLLAKYLKQNQEPMRKVEAFQEVQLFPQVEFQAPALGSTKTTLHLTDRGGGIGKVQVFVNGKEALADARPAKPKPEAREARIALDLASAHLIPGKPNVIEVVTWNSQGYLASRGLQRVWTPPRHATETPPELYLIIAGVSNYASAALNLRFAAKDAEDMAKSLELGAKRLFGAGKVHLSLLTTSDHPRARPPTKENLKQAFAAARQARPGDVLVVYLAGHGISLQQGKDLYCYLTRDGRTTDTAAYADPAVLDQSAVTSEELVDWIKQIPALKQVMVLDTCAAGAAQNKLVEHRDISGDQVRALDRLKDRTGFHVLMGCTADRVSYEATQYAQGLLTYALLQGLRGAALREGEYVDVSKLFQYAADQVPQMAQHLGGIQKPLIMAPRGTSFDIGQLKEDDRKAVPLAQIKPLILRPRLVNPEEENDDNLKLESLLKQRLLDATYGTARGVATPAVFVDAEDLGGAVRPIGQYTVVGDKVTVRLALRRDGKTIQRLEAVEGSKADLPGLAGKMAKAVLDAVKKL